MCFWQKFFLLWAGSAAIIWDCRYDISSVGVIFTSDMKFYSYEGKVFYSRVCNEPSAKELKVPLHLATARGSNTPPLWGEQAKEKLSHAPLLCCGVFDFCSWKISFL
ncbi:hypothetical protein D7V86_04750 [bacterium D16-51]|nr:hypothetical protein D7V96_05725 [bacterium D16-59]RKI61592.1 hypothetical protein D7V86_04750 [bacterium D16-51]